MVADGSSIPLPVVLILSAGKSIKVQRSPIALPDVY